MSGTMNGSSGWSSNCLGLSIQASLLMPKSLRAVSQVETHAQDKDYAYTEVLCTYVGGEAKMWLLFLYAFVEQLHMFSSPRLSLTIYNPKKWIVSPSIILYSKSVGNSCKTAFSKKILVEN